MNHWPGNLREMVEMPIQHGTWPVLPWGLIPGEKVSKAILEAAQAYKKQSGADAQFAFIWAIPAGADEFVEICGVTLVQASWVPAGFVVLARGGTQKIRAEFQHWARAKSGTISENADAKLALAGAVL